jgi:hypothetical protein
MTDEEVDRLLAQAVREAEPNELYKYRFAKLVAAAEHKAILETVDELTGAEQYRNAMFSDGYDYALGHVKQFIEGRAR